MSRPRSDGRVADEGGGRGVQPAAEQGRLAKPAADNDDSNSHEDYEFDIDMLKIDMLDINEFDDFFFYDKNKKHYKMTQQARRWGSVGYLYPLPCRVGSAGLTAMPPTRGRAELRRTTGRGRAREREREREREAETGDDGPRPDRS